MKLNRLRQQVFTQSQSAMIIFSDINITYLSGFTGHAATLVFTEHNNYLLTDYRYVEQAEKQATEFTVICRDRANQSLASLIAELLLKDNCQQVNFESDHISVEQWQQIQAEIQQQANISEFIGKTGIVETFRMVKSQDEIDSIRQAAQIADQALANILPLVKEGISERELSNELEYQMAKLGSEELSFATILLFGARAAMPHGIPSASVKLKRGDFILVDFGAVVNGYRSDMTRTFIFGEADEKQKSIYQTVKDSQQAALDAIKEGIEGKALQKIADDILIASEYGKYRGEGLGHGVGLQLHEWPFIGPHCDYKMELGCVFTVEPGIYIPDWGGVRIEDDVVLTENGLEILNESPKELIIL